MKAQIKNAMKSPLQEITGRVFCLTIALGGLALLAATNAGAWGRGGGGFGGFGGGRFGRGGGGFGGGHFGGFGGFGGGGSQHHFGGDGFSGGSFGHSSGGSGDHPWRGSQSAYFEEVSNAEKISFSRIDRNFRDLARPVRSAGSELLADASTGFDRVVPAAHA